MHIYNTRFSISPYFSGTCLGLASCHPGFPVTAWRATVQATASPWSATASPQHPARTRRRSTALWQRLTATPIHGPRTRKEEQKEKPWKTPADFEIELF